MDKEILVTRATLPPKEEYVKEISSIWETHWMTNMGEKHNELERELKKYLNIPDISLFVNGHLALELAIQAMGLKGEVITTPFTFASTTHAIVRNGLTPVFCDIDPVTFTLDADKIEDLITDKTCAIVPVHVYGNICNVEKIERIARRHDLKVIYDAAHAFGVSYRGIGIGNFGDASMFSFHATKVFNTIEGGAVCYKDKELGKKLYYLKNFGIENYEVISEIGANAKMNEFQAAMGLCNLRHVDEEIEKRKIVYERYIDNLSDVKGIILPKISEEIKPNYAYFPVLFEKDVYGQDRDEVFGRLSEQKIFARKYFYPLTNEYDCYKQTLSDKATPVALRVSQQVLTLPMYSDLEIENVDKICGIIRREGK